MKNSHETRNSERGKAAVIALVALAVVAVGALAYFSGQIAPADNAQSSPAVTAEAETTTEAVSTADAGESAADVEAAAGEGADATDATDATDAAAPASAEGEAQEGAEDVLAGQAKIEPGNPVVAKIGDENVTRLDVLNFITQLPPNIRQLPIEQLFPLAQEQVINSKVVEKNIDFSKVESDPEVKKQVDEAREQILRNAFLQKQVEDKLTDSALKKAYDDFLKTQPDVEEVKAAHILVEDEAVAKDIIAKLNAGGDFAALAKENSKDNTAENGGDLGYFAKADVVPEFAEAAFALKAGSYTKEPVKSEFGYHVIKQEEKRKRPKPTFEEAKPFLENDLGRKLLDDTLKGWREKETIEKFDINGQPVKAAAPVAGQ